MKINYYYIYSDISKLRLTQNNATMSLRGSAFAFHMGSKAVRQDSNLNPIDASQCLSPANFIIPSAKKECLTWEKLQLFSN